MGFLNLDFLSCKIFKVIYDLPTMQICYVLKKYLWKCFIKVKSYENNFYHMMSSKGQLTRIIPLLIFDYNTIGKANRHTISWQIISHLQKMLVTSLKCPQSNHVEFFFKKINRKFLFYISLQWLLPGTTVQKSIMFKDLSG